MQRWIITIMHNHYHVNHYHVKEHIHVPKRPPFLKPMQTWVNSSLVINPSRFLSKSLKAVSAFEALSDLLITSTLTKTFKHISGQALKVSLQRDFPWTEPEKPFGG